MNEDEIVSPAEDEQMPMEEGLNGDESAASLAFATSLLIPEGETPETQEDSDVQALVDKKVEEKMQSLREELSAALAEDEDEQGQD